MAIRTTVSEAVGRDRGELRKSITEIEESLDDMHTLKCKACAVVNVVERDNNLVDSLEETPLAVKLLDNRLCI